MNARTIPAIVLATMVTITATAAAGEAIGGAAADPQAAVRGYLGRDMVFVEDAAIA